MTIDRDRSKRTIKLGQERMVTELAGKYGPLDARPKSVPISTGVQLSKEGGDPLDVERYSYSALVGSLLYLSVCTRPDIAQSVGALAKYMAAPTTTHWTTAIGVLRYLAATASFGVCFGAVERCLQATATPTSPRT